MLRHAGQMEGPKVTQVIRRVFGPTAPPLWQNHLGLGARGPTGGRRQDLRPCLRFFPAATLKSMATQGSADERDSGR
jgi:hypothetical protein